MSGAAHDCVRACTHPQVKGPTRALFDAIAHFVPEGETTTPFIGMKKDLAPQARLHRRTVVTHLGILVEIGEVKVIDGGQGRPARYQIVHLDGPRPMVAAPLPLRADLQPVPPRDRPSLPEDTTGDLFAPPVEPVGGEEPAINLCTPITSTRRYLWSAIISRVAYLWSAITSTAQLVIGKHKLGSVLVIGDHKLLPQGVDDQLARDVHTFKNVHTPAAPRDGPTDDEMARWPATKVTTPAEGAAYDAWLARGGVPTFAQPKPPVHPWHAWCGLVCVPKKFHEAMVDKGHDAEWLFAFYARTCATLTAAEARRVVDEFKFWRTALQAELAIDAPKARAPTSSATRQPDIANSRPCPHQPICVDTDGCVDRQMAEWRAEQKRQSG